jgi:hypothetical protein
LIYAQFLSAQFVFTRYNDFPPTQRVFCLLRTNLKLQMSRAKIVLIN